MSSIRYAHDPDLVLPISAEEMSQSEREEWARRACSPFADLHGLDEGEAERLRVAIAQEQAGVQSNGAAFLAFDPNTRTFVVVRLAVVERLIGEEERRSFLRPSALLPGRLRSAVANSFGVGCSSAFPTPAKGGTGEIRWLYLASDASLLVVAAPIRLGALPSIGAIAEAVLRSVIVDEVAERVPAADFSPEALVAASLADQPRWSL